MHNSIRQSNNLRGDELRTYSILLSQLREDAIARMEAGNIEMVADDAVNVRTETSETTTDIREVGCASRGCWRSTSES
ncbi:heavy metal-binding domain-containing protein [Natronoarchaeum sp. GCM10025703]|uniref:heavy metal-binding domain-containing protein n=1 Tax=unclassified Natronoarchaeum TaxID=2620183 RepID=UPI003612876D